MNTPESFDTRIITLDGEISMPSCIMVLIPTESGVEGFMARHQNDSYVIVPGELTIERDDIEHEKKFFIGSGNALFENNVLNLYVMYAFDVDVQEGQNTASLYQDAPQTITKMVESLDK